jgi:acyl-CoA synthetase (NDP forming)
LEINFKNFFAPKTIALIGASENESKVGGILLNKLVKSGLKIIPINPNHDSILGLKCYKNVLDYKAKIDLVIIAIPSLFVVGSLIECGKKGITNAIIISAGFSEIGNKKGEEELVKIAGKYKIRLIGTNCFGICNPWAKLDTTFSAIMPKKGDIAFISQSGALWSYISDFSENIPGFGFSSFVSLGNMADLEFSDFIEYFSKDKKTKSIVLYVEKIKDGKKFIKACRACKKPIYAIKVGVTEKGSAAAVSHTASLASDYNVYRGAFKQSGVILCDSLISAFEKATGKTLIKEKALENVRIGRKTFIVTNAGGAGALMADYLSEKGFSVVDKPLDLLGTASGSDYFNTLEKLKTKDFFDSIIVILTPQSMSEVRKTAEAIGEFKRQFKKSVVALFLGGKFVKEADKIFEQYDVPYFNTLDEARESLVF